ncbi:MULTISPECIES: TonB-dependent siderophore receptor [unclassified Acinetobacter]|uniref:TonB-dependent receptor n=1 Tax=unclassified Acinetobacter TaxID=196816 RepID=UPI0015D1CCA8|nr:MULTISPECIES: TonB-dependent receptor [unclassified Acinetobacter]QOW50523.1 TonB-dependent receptor [Acinetobacter sp. YH12138]
MINFPKTHLVRAISIAILGVGTSAVVNAAERTVLETIEVEVPAEKQLANGKLKAQTDLGALGNKKIVDTPFSVAAYSKKLIEEQQASTVAQVLKNDASIRMTTNQGHLYENFQIRGFGVHGDEIALDGLYGMAPVSRVPTETLEAVMVLKGPNALVAGMAPNGGIGGVINITPKRAHEDLTRLTSTLEDEGYYQSHLDVSRRFGEQKKIGVRTNLVYGQGKRNIDGEEDTKALGSIAADYTTDQLQVNFDAYAIHEDRENGSPAMVSFAKIKKVIAAPEGGLNYFNDSDTQIDSKFVGLKAKYALTPNANIFAGAGYADKKYKGFVFGTRMVLNNEQGDATTQTYGQYAHFKNTSANIGGDYKFNTGIVSHKLGLRADYLNIQTDQHNPATSSGYSTNLYNPGQNGLMAVAPSVMPLNDNTFASYTLSDQISLLQDKLQFILGLRYQDMDLKNFSSQRKNSADWRYEENAWSPSLGLVVKPFGENLSLYANYVEGLSQGKTVTDESDLNFGKTFAPFKTEQYEVGAKYQNGSWLNTLALYEIKKPDTMVIDGATTDGAETRARGIEWSFSGQVRDGLTILGNMAYLDTEYTKALGNKGNELLGMPDLTATIGLDYALPLLDGLSVNGRVNYVGEQYVDSANTLQLPDFTTVDLGARYKTNLGGVYTTFMANVDNVTDKKYWEGVFNENFATIGADRTYKVGVTFDF